MKWEGADKLSLIKSDPGNWSGGKVGSGKLLGTQWGVSAPVALAHNLTPGHIEPEQALNLVYKPEYWDRCGGDALPLGLDLALVDCAYNAGVSRALTLYSKVNKTLPVSDQIKSFSAIRLAWLQSLGTWATFGTGWTNRVNGVRAEALAQASKPTAQVAPQVPKADQPATKVAQEAPKPPAVILEPRNAVPANPEASLPLGGLLGWLVSLFKRT